MSPADNPARTLRFALALPLLWVAASCAGGETPRAAVDIDGTAVPARIQIATASVGGSYYPTGNAIAQVLSNNMEGVVATAENSSGSNQNIRMLDAGQVDFGLANAAITYPAIRGIEGFEKEFPVEAVISLQRSVIVVAVLADSGITALSQLQGRRVAVGPAGGGWDYFMRPIFEAHGLPYDSFQKVYEGQASAMELLTDRAIDAVSVGGSVPHATIMAATATHELDYLEYDEAAVDGITEEYPFIQKFVIPAGTYEGQEGDLMSADSGTAQLLVRADADPDYVYLVTKTIYENRARIEEIFPPIAGELTPERAAMDIGIPYHEGSLRYFNEIGIWNPRPGTASN